MRLRSKTLIFIMPLIMAPIIMIGLASLYMIRDISEQELNVRASTLLDQLSQNLENSVNTARASLQLLADHQIVKQYALAEDETVKYELMLPHLLEVFSNLQSSAPQYYEIKYITPDGYEDAILTENNLTNINESIAHERYFHLLKNTEDKIFSALIFDENCNQHVIFIAQKLNLHARATESVTTEPRLRGYLSISLKLDSLKNHVIENDLGSYSFLSVLDDHANALFVANKFKPAAESMSSIYGTSLFTTQQGSHETIHNQTYTLNTRLLPAGMLLLSAISDREILEQSMSLGKIIVFITILALVFGIALTFVVIRLIIITPLDSLSRAAESIGEGKNMPSIDIHSHDEIEDLANTFSTMSKNLTKMHNEVNYTANHDGLTSLPNRTMFLSYLSNMISIASQKQHKIALLFIDLDDFKTVNDTLGHHVGDALLKEISSRLSETVRHNPSSNKNKAPQATDLVARLAGDEFVILLNDVEGPWEAAAVADRVIKSMQRAIHIDNHQLYASCSIGISVYPDDATSYNDLIQTSDLAMYHAKQQGKNHYQFYAERLNTDLHQRLKINSRLRQSIQENNFSLQYQPKINAVTGMMSGMEALLRWNDPELGNVSPAAFIPIAEESGLITPITEWIIKHVCKKIAYWNEKGLNPPTIAINVSSIQFKRRDLIQILSSSIEEYGIRSEQIEIELTETSLLTNIDDAIDILEHLSSLGIKVSLDDFGTGYSSLSYLNKLPIHALKIDRSFIMEISNEEEDHAIVDAILALAWALDIQVVAEGVETDTQLRFLVQRQCNILQGFFLSKPVVEDEIENLFNYQFITSLREHYH